MVSRGAARMEPLGRRVQDPAHEEDGTSGAVADHVDERSVHRELVGLAATLHYDCGRRGGLGAVLVHHHARLVDHVLDEERLDAAVDAREIGLEPVEGVRQLVAYLREFEAKHG